MSTWTFRTPCYNCSKVATLTSCHETHSETVAPNLVCISRSSPIQCTWERQLCIRTVSFWVLRFQTKTSQRYQDANLDCTQHISNEFIPFGAFRALRRAHSNAHLALGEAFDRFEVHERIPFRMAIKVKHIPRLHPRIVVCAVADPELREPLQMPVFDIEAHDSGAGLRAIQCKSLSRHERLARRMLDQASSAALWHSLERHEFGFPTPVQKIAIAAVLSIMEIAREPRECNWQSSPRVFQAPTADAPVVHAA